MRSLRGLALGLLTGAGALVAHAASGGSSTPGAAVVVLALAVGFCWLLAGGRFDAVAAVVIAVGAQAMSHATMSISAAMSSGAPPPSSPSQMAGGMVSVPPDPTPGVPAMGPATTPRRPRGTASTRPASTPLPPTPS